uniref:Globin domain-containing protein n=1 Tax=Homalodisca liturata TaxID=320908 RepID=A0A1B6JRB7_9HEMI
MASGRRTSDNLRNSRADGRRQPGAQGVSPLRRSAHERPKDLASLTDRDLRLGRATWFKNVDATPDFGMVIFKELFRQYPDVESYFLHLRGNAGSIFDSRTFRSHMTERVVPKLKEVFEALDKPEHLNEVMTKLGLYHAKLGVSGHLVENMLSVILDALKSVMHTKMQPDEETAVRTCLKSAFAIAIDTINNYEKENKQAATDS